MKEKAIAKISISNSELFTPQGRKNIAKWMDGIKKDLLADKLAKRFVGRFFVRVKS